MFNFGKPGGLFGGSKGGLFSKITGIIKAPFNFMRNGVIKLIAGPALVAVIAMLPASKIGIIIGVALILLNQFLIKPFFSIVWTIIGIVLLIRKISKMRATKQIPQMQQYPQMPPPPQRGQMPPAPRGRGPAPQEPEDGGLEWE